MVGLQVVVAGGGPCGVALALLLARSGWAVTLVEQVAPGATRPYRGEGLMPSGVEALAAMGQWPLPAQVRHRPLRGWAVVLDRRPFFTVAEPLAGDRGCWLVDQESLLAQLRKELDERNGVRVLEGQAVRGLRWAPRPAHGHGEQLPAEGALGRVAGVVLADGTELAADLVVACDGRHSMLRRQAGLGLQGEGARRLTGEGSPFDQLDREDPERLGQRDRRGGQALEGQGEAAPDRRGRDREPAPQGERGVEREREQVLWFRLAGDAVAPLERWLAGRFLTVVGAGVSFALFAEAAGEALRLGWVAEAGVALPADAAGWRQCWAAALPPEAAALVRELPLAAIEGPQRLPVQVGWAPRWHAPGLLLLGDAAHPMSPVRAQGINMALRDALVAGQLLGPLAGQAFEASLVDAPIHSDPPLESGPPRHGAVTATGTVTAMGTVTTKGTVGEAPADPAAAQASAGIFCEAPGPGPDAVQARALIDALLPRIAARRLPEIRQLQGLQAREAGLGARLRQLGWLRRGLAATAPWSGPLARRRWIQQQHRLRQGLPGALPLPE